jgi:hypothetical protein
VATAVEERRAHLLLELDEPLRERGLAEVEGARRPPEVAVIGDGLEGAEEAEFHSITIRHRTSPINRLDAVRHRGHVPGRAGADGAGQERERATMRSSGGSDGTKGSGPSAARTFEELGVPVRLARELEGALRALGEVADGVVTGRRFRTADGTWHEVRVGEEPAAGT